jgi:hypothetical protein
VSIASAAPKDLPIRYEAQGEGCPTAEAFEADVSQRLAGANTVGMRYVARVVGRDRVWEGTLTATDEDGRTHERSLRGTTCSETAHALAFMTALAIGLGGWPDAPPRVAVSAPPIVRPREATVRRASPPPPQPGWRGEVAAGVVARGGLAPTMSLGGELRLDVASSAQGLFAPSFDFAFDAIATPTQTFSVGTAQLVGVIGRIGFCPIAWAPASRVRLRTCGSLELGGVSAHGQTAGHTSQEVHGWVAFDAAIVVRFVIAEPLFLDLTAAALFPALRTTYEFGPDAPVFTVPPVTGRLVVALGLRIW